MKGRQGHPTTRQLVSPLIALVLLLSACAPAMPSAPPMSAEPAPPQTPNAAAASWRVERDIEGGYMAANYGQSLHHDLFRVFCGLIVKRVALQSAHTLPDRQQTNMVIPTAGRTVAFAARSENIPAGPLVFAEIQGDNPRLSVLSARQDRFAVEVEGVRLVIP